MPFAQQPRLQVRDANGNPVTQAGLAVTASIASGPVGATITGSTTAATDANGLATFSGLGIGGSGGTYTLNFGGAGLQGVTSGGITIQAGAATQLAIVTQPSSTAQSGAVLAQQPVVQLLDASGNPSAQAGVPVTAAIASGGGTLGGTVTRSTNASGQATFTDLSIAGLAGTRTLVFFSGGLSAATSGAIVVSAAPVSASQSTVSAAPGSFTAGSGASTITVVAKDASGGRVSGAAVTLSVSGSGNTVSTPAVTDANGTTTATLQSTGAGSKTITATINGVTVSQTATVTVSAAAPSATTSTAAASPTTVTVNQPSTVTVAVLDQFGNPVSGAGVTLAVSGGSGNSVVQPTGATGADGVATGTVSSSTAGTRTVTVTVNGSLPLAAQPAITVSGPPVSASRSTVTAAPATVPASAGTSTSTITVTVRDAAGAAIPNATVTLELDGDREHHYAGDGSQQCVGGGDVHLQLDRRRAEDAHRDGQRHRHHPDRHGDRTVASASAAESTAAVPDGTRNVLTVFTVQLRDTFANNLRTSGGRVTATVSGKNEGKTVTITDNNNGTYRGGYTPTASGHGVDLINIFSRARRSAGARTPAICSALSSLPFA